MYSFITCALLLTAAFGAPQDMIQSNGVQEVLQELPHEISAPHEMPALPETHESAAPETPESHENPISEEEAHDDKDAIKNPLIELIEGKVLEFSAEPLEKNTDIIVAGKKLSKVITAKIVAPALIFNGKVATAAAALPPLLAAKGAIIGKAIATPIEIGALASSGIITGVTGKLVAVPITLAAGAASKLIGAAEKGEQVVQFNLEHGPEILKNGLIRVGQIILKPIAIVVGAQTALTGAGLGLAGTGIKGVGVGVEAVGAKMIGTGVAAKVLGQRLIAKSFPPYL